MNTETDKKHGDVVVGSTALLGSVVRGRAEWLDLLHKCQNGEATCLFVLKEMESEIERENANLREAAQNVIHALETMRERAERFDDRAMEYACRGMRGMLIAALPNAEVQGRPAPDSNTQTDDHGRSL